MRNSTVSPLVGTSISMSKLDIDHKVEFEKFVLAETNGAYRKFVGELYQKWHEYKREYFNDSLVIPTYLTLSNPKTTKRLGEYSSVSSWGGSSEIRIRPTLFTGKHPLINAGAPMEGRKRFLFDILLHEMVHQYSHEALGIWEESFHGHGPVFRDECNRISTLLGITQRVRTCKKRGADKDLPSCAYWPHIVRPDGYYQGAVDDYSTDATPRPKRDTTMGYDDILRLVRQHLTEDEMDRLSEEISTTNNMFGYDFRHLDIDKIQDRLISTDMLLDVIPEYIHDSVKKRCIEGVEGSHDLAMYVFQKDEIN